MPHKDPSAKKAHQKAYMKAYYEAHREERKAYQKAYREAHREERKAYMKAYQKAYREAMPNIVYEFKTPEGRSIYIGSGKADRPSHHKYTSDWWSPQYTLTIHGEYESLALARSVEYRLIYERQPLFNRDGITS